MKEMATLKFPNQEEPYEIVDATARKDLSHLETIIELECAKKANVDAQVSGLESRINDKAPLEHTHDYLPLSGGTVDGNIGVTGTFTLGNAVISFDSTNKCVTFEIVE